MTRYEIQIEGFDPHNEIRREVLDGRYPVGSPIIARGSGEFSHTWHRVVTRDGVRCPEQCEGYLFK